MAQKAYLIFFNMGLSINYVTLREGGVGGSVRKNRYLYATTLEGVVFGTSGVTCRLREGRGVKKGQKIGLRNLWRAPIEIN